MISRLLTLGFAGFFVSCSETSTLSQSYSDSLAGANLPNFVVFVSSDLSSNFTQAITPATSNATQAAVYYFTSNPENLKNCVVAGNLVDLDPAYHSASPSLSQCVSFTDSLHSEGLFPVPVGELALTGRAVSIPSNGYAYALFFYNPNSSSPGVSKAVDVEAGQNVPSNLPCVKIWSAKVQGGSLFARGGVAAGAVDLKTLKCYGF